MEELEIREERPGIVNRFKSWFSRDDEFVEEEEYDTSSVTPTPTRTYARSQYNVTVRRMVHSLSDAVSAADGLKRGELQILNLSSCEISLREKIKDFMSGVNYSQEGTWEELGENVFMLAPPFADVEVAPASPRMTAQKN